MDHSVTFARHYARMLWLLVHEPSNVDEQKASLRALVTIARDGAVVLAGNAGQLNANGTQVPWVLAGVTDVIQRLGAHGVAEIQFDVNAAAAGVLGSARVLAAEAVAIDGGHFAIAKLEALGAPSVRFVAAPVSILAPASAVQAETPVAGPARATFPASEAEPTPAVAPIREAATLPDLGFGEVLDEQAIQAKLRRAPRASVAAPQPGASRNEGGMFEQFAAARTPTASHDDLVSQLDQSTSAGMLARVLDDLVLVAESAARDGKSVVVADILCRITRREPEIHEFESKRAFVMALRRLAKPLLLRAVTQQIPHAGDKRAALVGVLARSGEDGADALIEQIAAVSGQNDRRAYFDALVQLQAGVPTLVHMLGDARWFVARNAAELLGEMQAKASEPQLTTLLRHEDDRVRRAATGALMRLGTTRAMQAIEDALKDGAPAMRMQAAAALLTRKDLKTAATLVKALENEKDDEVQASFLLALGKLATPDAVQRLIKAVEAERGLFKKKSTAFRVAAVQGLAEAKSPEAMDVLKALQADKDEDVKSAVTFALLRIAKAAPIPTRPRA